MKANTLKKILYFCRLFSVVPATTKRGKKWFRWVWTRVWFQENYANNMDIVGKYTPFDKHSSDFLVNFLGVIPCATMRVIRNSKDGLPTLNDFQLHEKPWKDVSKVAEVTLLTTLRTFRPLPFIILMKCLYWHSKKMGFEGLIVGADERLFEGLTRKIKLPFHQIGPEIFYEGSMTHPSYMPFEGFEKIWGKMNPLLSEFVFERK